MSLKVKYKEIPNFPGYYAGTDGTIWSAWKRGKTGGRGGKGNTYTISTEWRKLSLQKPSPYYFKVVLQSRPKKQFNVHRVILETFIGPCPKGMVACHNDGNYTNNRLSNLRWATQKENMQDCLKHGNRIYGEKQGRHKLTNKDVINMRKEYAKGNITYQKLSDKYGVCLATVCNIIRKKNWPHI